MESVENILEVKDIDRLPAAAREICRLLDHYRIVALYGPMGAGKTTLIKEICACRGVESAVTSPTFSLVNHYVDADGQNIYHFDFYRINRIEEAFDLGYEEYFYSGDLCLVEWPEKIEALLPDDTLRIRIEIVDQKSRRIEIVTPEQI